MPIGPKSLDSLFNCLTGALNIGINKLPQREMSLPNASDVLAAHDSQVNNLWQVVQKPPLELLVREQFFPLCCDLEAFYPNRWRLLAGHCH